MIKVKVLIILLLISINSFASQKDAKSVFDESQQEKNFFEQDNGRIQLYNNIILPYAFEVNGSSPENLCESLNKYLLFLKNSNNRFDTIFKIICKDKLLKQICDVNIKDECGNTALHFAAQKGYLDVAKALIANDININALGNSLPISLKDVTHIRGRNISDQEKKSIISQCRQYQAKYSEKLKKGLEEVVIKNLDEADENNIIVECQRFHAFSDAILNGNKEIIELLRKQQNLKGFTFEDSVIEFWINGLYFEVSIFNINSIFNTYFTLGHNGWLRNENCLKLIGEYASDIENLLDINNLFNYIAGEGQSVDPYKDGYNYCKDSKTNK